MSDAIPSRPPYTEWFASGTRVRHADTGRLGTVDPEAVSALLASEYPDMVPVAWDNDDPSMTHPRVLVRVMADGRPSRDFFGGPPPKAAPRFRYNSCDDTCTADCGHCKGKGRPVDMTDPANVPPVQSEHEFLYGDVPPEVVFTAGGAIAAPSQARRYATFKPLLERIGPGAGAMVEREMDRARAFEVIARAAVEFIDAMTGDDWDEAHDALAEAVAENRAAIS